MDAEPFERALRDFRDRRPFRMFHVELRTGRVIDVIDPEPLIVRSGQAAYLSQDGPKLFDHEQVARVYASRQVPVEVRS